MGKTLDLTPEQQLVQKFRSLFDLTISKLDNVNFTFEDFIDSFDETDVFICRLFEFVVKDAGQKHRKKSLPQGHALPEDPSDPVSLRDVLINFRRRQSIFPTFHDLSQQRPEAIEPSLPFSGFPATIPSAPLVFPEFSSNELAGLSDNASQALANPSSPGNILHHNSIAFSTMDNLASRSNSISDPNALFPYQVPSEWSQSQDQSGPRTPENPETYASATLASLRFPYARRSSVPHFVRQHHLDAVRRLSLLRNHPYSSINSPQRPSRNYYPTLHNAFLPEFSINSLSVGLADPASGVADLDPEQPSHGSRFPFDPHQDSHEL